jgi:hypothetical protein
MTNHRASPSQRILAAATLGLVAAGGVASAQQVTTPAAAAKPTPPAPAKAPDGVTGNDVTLRLIHLLVKQKIITAQQADALFEEAKAEAAGSAAAKPAQAAAKPTAPAPAAAGPTLADSAKAPPPPELAPHSVRVTYVPETVREQIKEEVRQELASAAPVPGTAGAPPDNTPDWLRRLKIEGDFRLRYERIFNDSHNSPNFIDFNAINAGSPFDVSGNSLTFPPLLNTTEDRQLYRVRGRIGFTDQITDDVSVGFRLTTGNDSNPVSPNQTLGNSFNKYDVTFDRAWIAYQPTPYLTLQGGRFASPWFATDLVWYSDLNFDGFAASASTQITPTIKPFLTAGAFPIGDTALEFPTNSPDKVASRDKWLYAAQAGASWLVTPQEEAKIGFAYYDFTNLVGRESAPCLALTSSTPCSTDDTRAGFLQGGNTLFGIRDLLVNPSNPASPQYQYFGLATPFRVADVTARYDLGDYAPIHVILDAEAAANLAYNRSAVLALGPVNNFDLHTAGHTGGYAGGNFAYQAKLTVGMPVIQYRWDWNVSAAYKYLESDSVVDAFTDSDFHGGGTNAKGYIVIGNLGLAHNVWLSTRYFSATEVTGPPFAEDTLEVDLNAKF